MENVRKLFNNIRELNRPGEQRQPSCREITDRGVRVKGEIVFPNNIKSFRLKKGLTQAELGQRLDPPVVVSTISKMENGERRLTNLQLRNLAEILGCKAEEIPVVAGRDDSTEVRRWRSAQDEVIRQSFESGAVAVSYILAQLRKKHGKTMQQVANAIGVTISVYHRIEMASRMIQAEEIAALAKFYDIAESRLIGMFARRTRENAKLLQEGVPLEQLLPRSPRSLLKEDQKWGKLGALERYALRRSIHYVAPERKDATLPVCGAMQAGKDGRRHFVLDRGAAVDHVQLGDLIRPTDDAMLVRNLSTRLGFLMRPGALALVDPSAPVSMGDVVFLVRKDRSADAAVVVGDGVGSLTLRMYGPEEEVPINDPEIAAVYRVGMVIFP